MGVQIPRRFYSEVPQEDLVCRAASASGRCIPEIGRAKGKQDRGRSSSAGSRAHVDLDPPEARSVGGDRIYQGKERDPLGSRIRGEEAKLRRPTFLGEGIFRIHSRTVRSRKRRTSVWSR